MIAPLVEGAHQDQFAAQTARFRRELLAHCYRMAGAAHEAEDLVQETYLRAWRGFAGFEGRASLRSWLYKIATNVCLSALESRASRVLPSGLRAASDDPDRPPALVAPGDIPWLEPLPDAWIAAPPEDPAATIITRQSVRLALIASLQLLPARQRATFLLREVLAFSADETADLLGMTVAAVKSALQRARARLDDLQPRPEQLLEPTDPRARELLDGYIAAFERSDASLLVEVLRADATLEATPFLDWQAGRVNCIRMLERHVLGAPGDWRLVATAANGQPAAAVYHRDAGGALRARDIVVLSPTPSGISAVVAFHDPALAARFGFAELLVAETPSLVGHRNR
jgi:RNA polymerase sigma-70 factor (ECF subfamily)